MNTSTKSVESLEGVAIESKVPNHLPRQDENIIFKCQIYDP